MYFVFHKSLKNHSPSPLAFPLSLEVGRWVGGEGDAEWGPEHLHFCLLGMQRMQLSLFLPQTVLRIACSEQVRNSQIVGFELRTSHTPFLCNPSVARGHLIRNRVCEFVDRVPGDFRFQERNANSHSLVQLLSRADLSIPGSRSSQSFWDPCCHWKRPIAVWVCTANP